MTSPKVQDPTALARLAALLAPALRRVADSEKAARQGKGRAAHADGQDHDRTAA